ncbi:hypothetical protein [Streptomyces sp. ISL-100]|uniref:hypothetical protein n=1 Tax=Streptomyces sp. ISL-100 TaxID=2819173 RepID=UPI001BEB1151|nr:hypothetical protein [Streptomyces sp. ISL-100]MBT2395980.1 sel1 repeat family protein [Streptomyces sp. ISL-100]
MSDQRISDWLPSDPQKAKAPSDNSGDSVLALVRLWSAWAGEAPDERHWRNHLEGARPARIPRSASAAPGRPIREFADPFALEVHETIDGGVGPELPILPAYIEREHDRWLAEIVRRVGRRGEATENSTIAVLVGGSSTGKTRACWEALGLLPPEWRLWHPLAPSPSEALIAGLDVVEPYTALWLNETQLFLGGDHGEQAATRLREVINDPRRGPLLVLGTIWPKAWDVLVRPPKADGPDPHVHARALLTGKHRRVPSVFTDADMGELRVRAAGDRRLHEALERAEQRQITQYLAGGRALMERYDTATPLERAVIEAAMDARRLGHDIALPQELLEAAVAHYMTDQQYEMVLDGEFQLALDELGEPLRGTRGPLTHITVRRLGEPLIRTGAYRLADYLEQHGRVSRRTVAPPAGLWDVLVRHAARMSLINLAVTARERGHLRIALCLLKTAAEAGDPRAASAAANVLEEEEWYDEALLWCLPRAEAGDSKAMVQVAGILERTDRLAEAIAWYEKAGDAGYPKAWTYAGWHLRQAGRRSEALACYRRAIDAGAAGRPAEIAGLLADMGQEEEALPFYQQAAEADGGYAISRAAELMRRRGDDSGEVLTWLCHRVYEEDAKDDGWLPWAWSALIQHIIGDATLLQHMRTLLDRDDAAAQQFMAILWGWVGHEAEGGPGHERAVRAAAPPPMPQAAEALWQEGRPEEALAIYEHAAGAGDRDASSRVATLQEQLGRPSDALAWHQRAAEEGHLDALRQVARLMTPGEGPDATFAWLKSCADDHAEKDYPNHRSVVAELLHAAGRTDEALDWLRSASIAGDPYASSQFSELLVLAGRTEEGQRMRRYGWEPDGEISAPWSADPASRLR